MNVNLKYLKFINTKTKKVRDKIIINNFIKIAKII